MEEPTLVRKKGKRSKFPLHWAIIPLLFLVIGTWGWRHLMRPSDGMAVLPGYITNREVFDQETLRYYGAGSQNLDAAEKFQLAAESVSRHDYGGAAGLLEEAAKQAPLPVIFNDLGVLYAHDHDESRALNAFREALARDPEYVPVRQNLERFKDLPSLNTVLPVTREIEPNGLMSQANLIALGQRVEGEVGDSTDVDWYFVNIPASPRDRMQLEIASRDTLGLRLEIYDAAMNVLGTTDGLEKGTKANCTFSPAPNSAVYLKIDGVNGSTGHYTISIKAMKAFDSYEPNDEIMSAMKIATGQAIEANIMDAQDTDYYSFIGPRTGTVTIEIQNRSTTLIPAITTFRDLRQTGFGPDVTKPGSNLRHTIQVEENQTYYVQVWSHNDTAGDYTLKIQ